MKNMINVLVNNNRSNEIDNSINIFYYKLFYLKYNFISDKHILNDISMKANHFKKFSMIYIFTFHSGLFLK
jgi:ATP sulfurylase